MLEEMLASRGLPELKTREEMKEILLREEYGYPTDVPYTWEVGEPRERERRFDCATCALSDVDMTIKTEYGSHTFTIHRLLHYDGKKRPFIIYMDFSQNIPSNYCFPELLSEQDVDVLAFHYESVTTDNNDFTNGIAGILMPEGRKSPTAPGKLVLWAFAASRVLDYAETLDCLIPGECAVLGHSRLGKTALVAGMLDERFKYVCSNCSGCSGASLAKGSLGQTGEKGKGGGPGESYEVINRVFPYWFCGNFAKYGEKNYSDEFDQHYLLAAIAPRYLMVISADYDDWADPVSEQLCCAAAGGMWEKYGKRGFVHNDAILAAREVLNEGSVAYYRHSGHHFLSYHNWLQLIAFMKKNAAN